MLGLGLSNNKAYIADTSTGAAIPASVFITSTAAVDGYFITSTAADAYFVTST